jgi:glycosyltransferase involved in cell wall biosynthesis
MSALSEIPYSLIIPAYNEERRIEFVFDRITGFDGELIVICDGDDRTPEVVSRIITKRPDLKIRCLTFQKRLGKGGGVIAGLKAACAPKVGFFDADGSTSIAEMERLFSCLDTCDCAIGSRWIDGSVLNVRQGMLRRLESRGFNLIIRLLFNLPFHDTQCGAKVFRKKAIDAVLPVMKATGFEFDVEILWRMINAGYTVAEIPIAWNNTGDSRVQSSDMIRMLLGLMRIRFDGKDL